MHVQVLTNNVCCDVVTLLLHEPLPIGFSDNNNIRQ